MKVLFLYTELAGYILASLKNLAGKGVEIHVVHKPVNSEAPFTFSDTENIFRYEKSNYTAKQLIELAKDISPDIICCSGWIDKSYLNVCEKFRNKIPTIVCFDNKWTGAFRQKIGVLLSKNFLHKYFSGCWVPGMLQMEYAHRLGFSDTAILSGFYSCDYDFFHNIYMKVAELKKQKFPHRFLFAGRYYSFKGIEHLWQAFIELQNENPNDWELWCIGTGDIKPVVHPKIMHFGFIQPDRMEKFITECGVFILPSTFEPWGVAVHEFASAGFPLLCSNEVGAATMFLKEPENGFIFKSGDINNLKKCLNKIISMPDHQLIEMGKCSVRLAEKITPDKWSDTLLSVLSKNVK